MDPYWLKITTSGQEFLVLGENVLQSFQREAIWS